MCGQSFVEPFALKWMNRFALMCTYLWQRKPCQTSLSDSRPSSFSLLFVYWEMSHIDLFCQAELWLVVNGCLFFYICLYYAFLISKRATIDFSFTLLLPSDLIVCDAGGAVVSHRSAELNSLVKLFVLYVPHYFTAWQARDGTQQMLQGCE